MGFEAGQLFLKKVIGRTIDYFEECDKIEKNTSDKLVEQIQKKIAEVKLTKGALKMARASGKGAGSYKVVKAEKPKKVKKAKKPKAKKPKKAAKKPAAKKAAKKPAKKAAKKPAAKKAAAKKKPAKKAAKAKK